MPEEKTKPAVSQQDHPGIVDLITVKIQRGERRALPQHFRQAPSPFIPDVIVFKIQRGER
jgi:hypothetical protein